MTTLIAALWVLAQLETASPPPVAADLVATPAVASPAAVLDDAPYPTGAPHDDYGLVGWCYGTLGAYLDLRERVLPEVERIEGAYRRPGGSLADDMKVYADLERESLKNMKAFTRAMKAAETASLRPLAEEGAGAIRQGRSGWSAAANLPTRTVAQQWMGWALPARCTIAAASLEARARLMGATFRNTETTEPASPADPTASAPIESHPKGAFR